MALTTKIRAEILASLEGSADHGTPRASLSLSSVIELLSGTDADEADKVFSDQRTLAASATEDLDLSGTLEDALGAACVFAEVAAIMIKASSGNTNNVIVGNGTNPFVGAFGAGSHTLVLAPGDVALLYSAAGWGVTAGSADILKIANSAGGSGVTYDIIIIGRSA